MKNDSYCLSAFLGWLLNCADDLWKIHCVSGHSFDQLILAYFIDTLMQKKSYSRSSILTSAFENLNLDFKATENKIFKLNCDFWRRSQAFKALKTFNSLYISLVFYILCNVVYPNNLKIWITHRMSVMFVFGIERIHLERIHSRKQHKAKKKR